MADVVFLNDGSMEVILCEKDVFFENLLYERLGEDAARCFRKFVDGLQHGPAEFKEQVKELEQTADGYYQMCHEACDNLTKIIELLNSPRLDRRALKRAAQNAYNAIWKNL